MSSYNIPHGSTSNSSCSTCSKISYDREMQQLRDVADYALTATADVPVVYLQQFLRTVSKVPGPEDTIKFMLNTQEFIYTLDMFRDTLHLPVETPDNLFVAPVNIETIEVFMNKVGYQGVVDKVSAFYTKNLAQPWKTMFKVFNRCLTTRTSGHDQTKINILKLFHVVINRTNVDYAALLWWDFMNNKFPEIPQRIEEDYYSIKDDIPLIRATDDFKEYETVFMNVYVPMNQPKLAEEEIEKMVEGDEDKESYESEFADSVLNDDVDDSCTRLEPGSHKENPKKVVDDDVEIEKEKKDDIEIEKEKKDDVVKEKDIVDDLTGSMEIRKEQKQTSIPSPTRSPRNVSSSDKTVFKELTATVSPITATTSKDSSTKKRKKRSFSHKTKTLPGNIAGMCRRRINKDHEVDPINAQEMIAKEFATHGPKMIEELFRKHMHNTTLNLYPTTSTLTAGKSSADLQHQLYLNMKSKPQDQAADPEIWEILKAKCLVSHAGLPASFWGFGAAKMFHTVIYEFLDARHLCIFPNMKDQSLIRDVVFEEDLTLKDVEKAEREIIPQHNDDLIDLDLVPPKHFDSQSRDDIQNDKEQGADDVDAQEQPNLDEDVSS
ncbi:hypothetical protein Tco_0291873 [Tanacetum coccineum]